MEISQNFVAFSEYMNFMKYILAIAVQVFHVAEKKYEFLFKLFSLPTLSNDNDILSFNFYNIDLKILQL